VLVGEMSLVGPVPEEGDVVQRYDDWHRQRLAIRPGMTGPSQVSERGALGLDERVRMELDYIEHYSLWRDMCILFRAVATALSGRSAP
jgi:lipopolysaccharide/colanic/teichoic acid biosynthesis glycosyltransferase